jgi:hypothetical protein
MARAELGQRLNINFYIDCFSFVSERRMDFERVRVREDLKLE